jgi:hypothetical protein
MRRPEFILSSDLAKLGQDTRDLSRRSQKGELLRIRQGVYVTAKEWAVLLPWEKYPLLIRAAAATLKSRTVFCRQSSAAVWGIPILGTRHMVHALTSDGSGGRSRAGVRRHYTADEEVNVVERGGLLVTDRIRTVLDLAAFESFEQGVVAFDHVLRADPVLGLPALVGNEIAHGIRDSYSAAAVRRIRAALDFADPLSQSPGESVSRAFMFREGFKPPRLQTEMRDARGLIGFTDFDWPGEAIVGEFDGAGKYRKPEYLQGRTPSDVVVEEKLREDRIRALGFRVVRWTWKELANSKAFAAFLDSSGIPRQRRRSAG